MAVTLATARANVRDLIAEPVAQFWSDAQLNEWINQGCADFAAKTRTLRTKETITVTAMVQNYTASTDQLSIYRIEYVPTGQSFVYPLTFQGYNEMDQAWGVYQTLPGPWPEFYTLWGNPPTLTIRLFPVPTQGGVLNCYGYRQATPAAVDTDDIDIQTPYEEAAYEFAAYKAFRADQNPHWQEAMARYSEIVQQCINQTGWYTDQPNTFSTGEMLWPPWSVGLSGWEY